MKIENTYQLIKEFKFRDLEGIDHFRYFIEKNEELLSETITDTKEIAEQWLAKLQAPDNPLPSKITILETVIVEQEEGFPTSQQIDNKLSKMLGFDVNDLDDLDLKKK